MDNSNTKKEGVACTYKGHDGYAPIAAYLGTEGWCLGCELRPGNQHANKAFIHTLDRVLPRVRQLTDAPLLVRLDSAHDAAENRAYFRTHGVDYLIKWNPRSQDGLAWVDKAHAAGALWCHTRPGKMETLLSERLDGTDDRLIVKVTVRHPAKRRRLKTVMQELMYMACRLVSSGRRLYLRFGQHCPGFRAFGCIYESI